MKKMNLDADKMSKLIVYLCTLKGWSIKNYDHFAITWEDNDGFPNWCDNDTDSYSGLSGRLERLTKNSKMILGILGWEVNKVNVLNTDAVYMENFYGVKALE